MAKELLYPCCNTCKHKVDNFYKCSKPKDCFNGFSAYEPNEKMVSASIDNQNKSISPNE